MPSWRRPGAIAATTVACFGFAGVATAEPREVSSRIHIHGAGPPPEYSSFVGDVHSAMQKCERRRTVILIYDEEPAHFQAGNDVTDRDGHWTIQPVAIGDDPYYAVVKRKVVGRGDGKLICKADRSPRSAPPPVP